MTNTQTRSTVSVGANARRSKPRKSDTSGARALLVALAMGATLGGWAIIAKDTPFASPPAVFVPASDNLLTPLPTVVPPPADLDQIASSVAPALQQVPLPSAPRLAMLRPLARSRSSN